MAHCTIDGGVKGAYATRAAACAIPYTKEAAVSNDRGPRCAGPALSISKLDTSVHYIISKMAAAPMPPPMHIETMPLFAFRRFNSWSSWAVSFAPVHPRG